MHVSLAGLQPEEIKSVMVLQSFSYSLSSELDAHFKLPVFNVFETPNGFSHLQASGSLTLN